VAQAQLRPRRLYPHNAPAEEPAAGSVSCSALAHSLGGGHASWYACVQVSTSRMAGLDAERPKRGPHFSLRKAGTLLKAEGDITNTSARMKCDQATCVSPGRAHATQEAAPTTVNVNRGKRAMPLSDASDAATVASNYKCPGPFSRPPSRGPSR